MTFTHAVVLDFEATCDEPRGPSPQEVIEFPSVLLRLSDLTVVDSFERFVRPTHHPSLTAFCTELTSITQDQVDGADPFAVVYQAHQQWLAGHGLSEQTALLVTCGDWDLRRMLPQQLAAAGVQTVPPLYRRWLNLKVPFKVLHPGVQAGMAGMLRAMSLPLIGRHHRGIDDCHNLARVLIELLGRGAVLEPSAHLPRKAWPPIDVVLRAEDRAVSVSLHSRSLDALRGLIGQEFRRKTVSLSVAGVSLTEQGLLDLEPGEAIDVVLR